MQLRLKGSKYLLSAIASHAGSRREIAEELSRSREWLKELTDKFLDRERARQIEKSNRRVH
jgi:hypothetical protein